MEVKLIDNDVPFLTITLNKKEAAILKELVRWDINRLKTNQNDSLSLAANANDYFAMPLCAKLTALGVY